MQFTHVHYKYDNPVTSSLNLKLPTSSQGRLPLQRVCLWRGIGILFPDFDSLISLTTDQPRPRMVKNGAHHPRLSIQTARLSRRVQRLEPMPALPVPKAHRPVVSTRKQHVLVVDRQGVDNGVVAVKVLHEGSLGALPLLDAPCAACCEGELGWVGGQGADALFVVGQHAHCLARGEIPHSDGGVQAAGYDLGVGFLTDKVGDGAGVARQDMDIASGAHVPYTSYAVAATGDEDVEGWVELEGVYT